MNSQLHRMIWNFYLARRHHYPSVVCGHTKWYIFFGIWAKPVDENSMEWIAMHFRFSAEVFFPHADGNKPYGYSEHQRSQY